MGARWIFPLLAAASIASAEAAWTFDFERGVGKELELAGATVTDNRAAVITGRRCLVCDSRANSGEWNEFLKTAPQVKLQRGKTYTVSFDYRIIDKTDPKSRMYCMARSRSVGASDDVDIYGAFWTREIGATDHVDFVFKLEKADDYYILIGLRRRGVVAIDNLQIVESGIAPPGAGLPIKNVYGEDLPIRRAVAMLETTRRRDGMRALLDDMLVITLNEGAGDKVTSRTDQIAADLQPDFVDWHPIGPLAKKYGVRTSGGAIEYQEYYKFEGPDVWPERYRLFVGNGFGELLWGTIVQDETWGEGGYFMSHVADGWHDYYLRKTLAAVDKYAAICQDNIGCATFHRGKGSFSDQADAKFRAYLQSRYTPRELAAFGIEDPSSFAVRRYICRMGNLGRAALADPIVREYVKWRYVAEAQAWADCVIRFKQRAASQGRILPVYGNQSGGAGSWPFPTILSQFNDVVEIEEILSVRNKVSHEAMAYKLALASGRFERPVWIRGPVVDRTKDRTPMLSTSYWRVHFAEALANGGVRAMSLGVNRPWTGDPDTLDYIDDPELYALYKDTARFIDSYRGLFVKRQPVAAVAVVYSLPTMMWQSFGPLGMEWPPSYGVYRDAGRRLEDWHVPYDVIMFGHPELFDDGDQLARLSGYKVVVLPAVECITPAQLQALSAFTAAGGTIVYAGDPPRYDQNLNPLPADAAAAVRALGGIDLQDDRDRAREVLQAASNVSTDLPGGVVASVWRSVDGDLLAVHLVNYDVDIRRETVNRKMRVKVEVELPDEVSKPSRAVFYCPERRPMSLTFWRDGGRLKTEVPMLEAYGIVAFTKGDAVARMTEESRARRRSDRADVQKLAQRLNLY